MTSAPARDPLAGHLLTPDNAALLLIGYQPSGRWSGMHRSARVTAVRAHWGWTSIGH